MAAGRVEIVVEGPNKVQVLLLYGGASICQFPISSSCMPDRWSGSFVPVPGWEPPCHMVARVFPHSSFGGEIVTIQ